jgi:hypothetical protein
MNLNLFRCQILDVTGPIKKKNYFLQISTNKNPHY